MSKVLVVAEKPSVARDIAKVLNCNKKSNGYIEGDKYIITWALGHLVGLKEPGEYKEEWKRWSLEELPIIPEKYGLKVLENTKDQFKVVKTLINRADVDYIINAGDAGREGLLIQNWIYTLSGNKKPIKLLWISSQTDEAIKKGFNNLKDNKDFLLLQDAAEVRAIIDWVMGMSYTRAYTLKKGDGGKIILSIGRCQTPVLNLIVQRDYEIENFKPVPYYQIEATFSKGDAAYKGFYTEDNKKAAVIESEDAAEEILNKISSSAKVIEVKEERKKVAAPLLYDLTTLQQVMDKRYGYSASETLKIAQALYEKHKILSYPRTSSRYLSKDIFGEIREHLECIKFDKFEKFIDGISNIDSAKGYFNDNKVTDHHALIPTINKDIKNIYSTLNQEEKNVFDEIILSLIAIFYPEYEYTSTSLITEAEGYLFLTRGKVEKSKGWKIIKQDIEDENKEEENSSIPDLKECDTVLIDNKELLSKMTKPKSRYTEASILDEMKKYNIGTQATRNDIIDKLKIRKYCDKDKKKLISTKLGRSLIAAIDNEEVKSIELTSDIENKLSMIEEGKMTRTEVLNLIYSSVRKNVEIIKQSENIIRKEDVQDQKEKLICPLCKEGYIFKNSKAYSCSNWKNGCKFTVWREIAGKDITENMVKMLITKGKTNLIKGFKSKKNTSFDAYLVFKNNKIDFQFKK